MFMIWPNNAGLCNVHHPPYTENSFYEQGLPIPAAHNEEDPSVSLHKSLAAQTQDVSLQSQTIQC